MTKNQHVKPDAPISEKKVWSLEQCKVDAEKYASRTEFSVQSGKVYAYAYKQGWLDQCCSHMVQKKKTNGYWTKSRCAEAAKKYQTRTEFSQEEESAYTIAKRNDWLDEICTHMERQGNSNQRKIYVFEFSDNHAYVGLTWNPEERYKSHTEQRGPVFKHIQKTGSPYDFKLISDGHAKSLTF